MESEIRNIEEFDKSLSGLFTLLQTIIKTHEKHKLNFSSGKNPVVVRLERYIKIHDKTDPEDHVMYFSKIFNKNRPAILRGPDRDNWLRNGNVTFYFGEEIGKRTAGVHLSVIYNTAIKLRDDVEESLHGLPDIEQSQEIIYPTVFMLHLYRIFREISESEDEQGKLTEHIHSLESDLGMEKGSKSRSGDGEDNGIDGLLGMATGFMEQMGLKLPEGQKLPSGSELNKAISGVMKTPQAKSFFGDIMKEMQECDNFGDVVGKLLTKLPANMDPAAMKALSDNVQSATQGTAQGSDQGSDQNSDHTNNSEAGEYVSGDEYEEFLDDGDGENIFLDE